MIYQIDDETIEFLCEKKISFTQFCICLLIYHKDHRNIVKLTTHIGYLGDCLKPKGTKNELFEPEYVTEIEDLIERCFILNMELTQNGTYDLNNLILTAKFTEGFLVDTEDIAKELWDEYPNQILIGDQELTSKQCNFHEFSDRYNAFIQHQIRKHRSIMNRLREYKIKEKYARLDIMSWLILKENEKKALLMKEAKRSTEGSGPPHKY